MPSVYFVLYVKYLHASGGNSPRITNELYAGSVLAEKNEY